MHFSGEAERALWGCLILGGLGDSLKEAALVLTVSTSRITRTKAVMKGILGRGRGGSKGRRERPPAGPGRQQGSFTRIHSPPAAQRSAHGHCCTSPFRWHPYDVRALGSHTEHVHQAPHRAWVGERPSGLTTLRDVPGPSSDPAGRPTPPGSCQPRSFSRLPRTDLPQHGLSRALGCSERKCWMQGGSQ